MLVLSSYERVKDIKEKYPNVRILAVSKDIPEETLQYIDSHKIELSPNAYLLNDYKSGTIDWKEFKNNYTKEMTSSIEASKTLEYIKNNIKSEPICLVSSEEDYKNSHMSILIDLVLHVGKTVSIL